DDFARADETAGEGGLAGTHGVEIADGKKGELGAIEFLEKLHVGEDVGIAGEVEGAIVGETENVARRLAAIDHFAVIEEAATVDGVGHGDGDVANLLRAALVHGAGVGDAFRLEPVGGLKNGNHFGGEFPGDGNGVVDVVEVAVGDADGIDAVDGVGLGIAGI